jgi:hypothetical protein
MVLEIDCDDLGYHVALSPPQGPAWRSDRALTATEVMERLHGFGCHQTDVVDALNDANPGWRVEHDVEIRRRRALELEAILREAANESGHDDTRGS